MGNVVIRFGKIFTVISIFLFGCVTVWAAEIPVLSSQLVGGEFKYTVQPGDTLTAIGARFGMDPVALGEKNGIGYRDTLKYGKVLRVDNRHIVPMEIKQGVLINLPQRMLYLFQQGKLAAHYPVGVGLASLPTPTGGYKIASRVENPVWYVPKDIQDELRAEGKSVMTQISPGPDNPLGRHWIGLDMPGYGIHGTIAPSSVYHFLSHGCVRLHPDDIAELFPRLKTGEAVQIIYEPVMMAAFEGRLFLEVHPDAYMKEAINPTGTAKKIARAHQLEKRVDWKRVAEVVRYNRGIVADVTQAEIQ